MGATWRKLIILGLLLEFSPENRDPKSRGSTQMKSRDPVFWATAGDALRKDKGFFLLGFREFEKDLKGI